MKWGNRHSASTWCFDCWCQYCSGATYLWRYDDGKSVKVWIEIPKNGSHTIKVNGPDKDLRRPALSSMIGDPASHVSEGDLKQYQEGFVLLREPVDRFKSLVAHYFMPEGGRYKYGVKWLREIGEKYAPDPDPPSHIVDIVLNNFLSLKTIEAPHHWNPQASFIPSVFYELEIKHFYTLDWLKKFPITNTSPTSTVEISEEQKQKILKLYKEDKELYDTYIS